MLPEMVRPGCSPHTITVKNETDCSLQIVVTRAVCQPVCNRSPPSTRYVNAALSGSQRDVFSRRRRDVAAGRGSPPAYSKS
jgi:hypothetical protein